MKVKIGENIYDSNNEPIALVFLDDTERIDISNRLGNMAPRKGARIYMEYPDGRLIVEAEKYIDNIITAPAPASGKQNG